MKIITRCLIMLSVFCISKQVQAHQPDLSSIILSEQDNGWVLQVRSALTAFEYEIEAHFGEGSYATPEEFQELTVNYIRDHISILFNESNAAVLQKGMVKLGHETNVIFQLTGIPENIHSLTVENKSFGDIPRNQSVLMVYKEGLEKDQFMLNETNAHSIKLNVSGSKFEVVEQDQTWAPFYFLVFAIVIVTISMLFYFYKKRQSFSLNSPVLERELV